MGPSLGVYWVIIFKDTTLKRNFEYGVVGYAFLNVRLEICRGMMESVRMSVREAGRVARVRDGRALKHVARGRVCVAPIATLPPVHNVDNPPPSLRSFSTLM